MTLFAAIDANGETRFIGDVARGAACGCFCAECNSPVVAKQGNDHVWHFAHEASQERPQCLPGSVNLLRRLAIEKLLESDTLVMPECKKTFAAEVMQSPVEEVARWTLPRGLVVEREPLAAVNKPVARYRVEGRPDCLIGLWVQIGDTAPDEGVGHCDGELIYRCPVPGKGEITTEASAAAFLREKSGWHWLKLPDPSGEQAQAQERLRARVSELQADQRFKLQSLRDLHSRRDSVAAWRRGPGYDRSLEFTEDALADQPEPPPAPAPSWAVLKKKNSSAFAFQMRNSGEFWIVIQAADHPGYYVIPGEGLWDGWDEALPQSVGHADLAKGAYVGEGNINVGIELIRRLGVSASRTDSDVGQICAFTGWKESS